MKLRPGIYIMAVYFRADTILTGLMTIFPLDEENGNI